MKMWTVMQLPRLGVGSGRSERVLLRNWTGALRSSFCPPPDPGSSWQRKPSLSSSTVHPVASVARQLEEMLSLGPIFTMQHTLYGPSFASGHLSVNWWSPDISYLRQPSLKVALKALSTNWLLAANLYHRVLAHSFHWFSVTFLLTGQIP